MVLVVGYAIAKTISGVLVNHVIEHFDLIGASQGYMNSMISIGITAAVLSTIVLRWKFKKTSIIVFSGILTAATMLFTGLSVSFFMLLAVSLVLGVSLGWIDIYSNSCIVDVNRAGSAKNQSVLQGWYSVGAIVAPVVVAILLVKTSWQGVYVIFAPFILMAVLVFAFNLKVVDKQVLNSGMDSPKITRGEIKEFLKEKRSLILITACMTYYIMQYGLFAWLVRYMSVQYEAEGLGMTSITVMWICTAISRFAAPRLPIDNMKLHAYGSLIAGATLFIGIFYGNAWIMCVVVGIGALTTGNSLPALINRCVVTYEGNTVLPTAAMVLSIQIIGMIVPPVLGAIAAYSMQGSMILLVIAIFISGIYGFLFMRANHGDGAFDRPVS